MKLIFFCVLFFTPHVKSSRILAVVADPSYSHQSFFRPLWKALALRGHEVVLIATDSMQEPIPNLQEVLIPEMHEFEKHRTDYIMSSDKYQLRVLTHFGWIGALVADFELSLPQVQRIINNETEHFDLLIIESWVPAMFAIKHRFKCPFIMIASYDTLAYVHEAMGNPTHLIQYPNSFISSKINITFYERLKAFLLGSLQNWSFYLTGYGHNRVIEKFFGRGYPDYAELLDSADMLFINTNPVFVPLRPYAPNTISLVGGMHLNPPKVLPKDLQSFLDASKCGVIYFNLGSSVISALLSNETQTTILQTFAKLPYNVLWKFESDNIPGKADNVKYVKWAPQQDILRHEKVKLFITQGGMQSLDEALSYHIPLLAIPFYADQHANANIIKEKGLGKAIERHDLTGKAFRAAILEVITNPTYKRNIIETDTLVNDIPLKPVENAVWWTEYVLRHKGAKLLKGPKLIWYQYYYLDIFAIFGMLLVLNIILLKMFLKVLFRQFRNVICRKIKAD